MGAVQYVLVIRLTGGYIRVYEYDHLWKRQDHLIDLARKTVLYEPTSGSKYDDQVRYFVVVK